MSVVAAATNAVSPTLDNATDSATALTTPKEVKEITEATANDLVVDSAAKPAPMPVEEGAAVEAGEVNDAKEKVCGGGTWGVGLRGAAGRGGARQGAIEPVAAAGHAPL